MSDIATVARLMDACEQVLCEAEHLDDATVRKVVARAGTNVSAIHYHFGSHEKLIFSVAKRVYHRLNAQRLSLLQSAVDRGRPGPPVLDDLIGALIGPSIRWSLDPNSSYPVLAHVTTMMQRGKEPDLYRTMIEGIEHHRAFVPHLRRVAPWFDDSEIGWRISCALGIRSQVIRHRMRTQVLTNHEMDLDDADGVIDSMIAVILPMFARPAGFRPVSSGNSNSVSNLSRS
jgi:AcrR family transcriptional regulator